MNIHAKNYACIRFCSIFLLTNPLPELSFEHVELTQAALTGSRQITEVKQHRARLDSWMGDRH